MQAKADKDLLDNMVAADTWDDFLKSLDHGKVRIDGY